jgi:molybdopterin-guanine dinucleotide biosynthesis protein A
MGGCDKGLLPLAGQPLVAHVIARLRPQVAELLISANRNLSAYAQFGCRVIQDEEEGQFRGPLAGVLAGLKAATTPYVLTAPCDAPLLLPDYGQRMWQRLQQAPADLAVGFFEGCWQPMFALLPVTLCDDLAAYLATGAGNAGRWLQRHHPVAVDFAEDAALAHNLNTPQDLQQLESAWPTRFDQSMGVNSAL